MNTHRGSDIAKGRNPVRWLILLASLGLSLNAMAQMDMSGANAGMKMPATGGDSSHSAYAREMDASMKKMDRDMASASMTGDPDHDFVAMMIPHHQGAIDMAEVELKHGKDPHIRELCHEIIAAQRKEIAQMKAWLAEHPGKK